MNGRPGSVYRDSIDELWNADEIVQVRAAMARGEKPKSCGVCWKREAEGGVSRRLLMNSAYRQIGGRLAVDALAREGAVTGYRLERRPDWFILELGNVCNLKCRSCSPLFSSRIAADSVHTAWTDDDAGAGAETRAVQPVQRDAQLEPKRSSAWFENIDEVADMIAGGADGNAMLSLIGGEPFLIRSTWRLLDALVARGVAQHLYVGLLTNGQQRSTKLEELAPRFRGFNVSVSIDGHGKLYEYLRHGATWRKLVENLDWLRQVPNVVLTILPTFQNSNALDMVTLLRFLDEHDLPVGYNVLNWPRRLRPDNLPPSVRRVAVKRLRGYLDAECKPANFAVVRGYCDVLEEAGNAFDADVFDEFMTFTNDLDADRRESLREAAPELVALIRAAGIEWSDDRRHAGAAAVRSKIPPADVLRRVNRTVSSRDVIFPGFEANQTGLYFSSAANQLAEIDLLLQQHGHHGLAVSTAVADFACHYGRMTRVLRAALPHAAVYACDIDPVAVQFCADELGALPVVTGWRPDEEQLPDELDAVICVSLLTHTPLEHWRRVLRAWARMLRPGGVAAFTYLSERYVDSWLADEMLHYGTYADALRTAAASSLRERGFGFAALTSGYGGEPFYGIAFATTDIVQREIAAAGLELLALPDEARETFGQDLALVRKPNNNGTAHSPSATIQRDVSLVAMYDPRCYSPAESREGDPADNLWTRQAATHTPRPLPTELGFGDPRVPEVREAQASLAREHGVDAFCYLYFWGANGPRWDAPLRDMVASGRPDFPFCLMVAVDDGVRIDAAAAVAMLDDIAPVLRDTRYLRVDGRCPLFVRDLTRFVRPREIAATLRDAAAARGLGQIHLSAVEPAPADRPEDLGFDSFLESPASAAGDAGAVAAALGAPARGHRFFRTVVCRRDPGATDSAELYEHWLHSVVDATRRCGEKFVFLDAWNDWPRGAYLEPDDRDGRAALLATRRAARGPASGLVLLRKLRDSLGEVSSPAAVALTELGQVLALHEHTRDRLLASVEVQLGRDNTAKETRRWIPVSSRHLPASEGGCSIDRIGAIDAVGLHEAHEPIALSGDEMYVAGWAHTGNCAPADVDLFVVLEACEGGDDRVFRVTSRSDRPDVAAAFPGFPAMCGFDMTAELEGVPPGTYRIAVVQRSPHAAYRDTTPRLVKRD